MELVNYQTIAKVYTLQWSILDLLQHLLVKDLIFSYEVRSQVLDEFVDGDKGSSIF